MKTATRAAGLCFIACAAVAAADLAGAQAKREESLRMAEIVRAMGATDGAKVGDIGAGSGYYDVALSRAVGANGRVYAEDIANYAMKDLHKRVHESHLRNMEIIHGTADDPKLPAGSLDAALMVIMYHEIADHQKMLSHVSAALKPGGRLVIVDMTPHKTITRSRADQVKNHVIAPDIVESEVKEAGFEEVSRDDHFIDKPDEETTRWMIVFKKP